MTKVVVSYLVVSEGLSVKYAKCMAMIESSEEDKLVGISITKKEYGFKNIDSRYEQKAFK